MKYILNLIIFIVIQQTLQAQSRISGFWQGTLPGIVTIHVVFNIQQKDSMHITMDIPEQGIQQWPVTNYKRINDSIYFRIPNANAQYAGVFVNDSTIKGYWIQGAKAPLNLLHVEKAFSFNRPQTPAPPFSYHSDSVIYYNPSHTIRYGATITYPNTKGPFTSVLLLTGSGQQNRDEQILGHKPFAVIADYLTRHGYLVMRVDDRGMGLTTGNVDSATTRDFANDAEVSLNYLKQRKEVNIHKVGLLGHSEGGMIAQIIAAERSDIHFIIFLAGPGENIVQLMTEQNEANLKSLGMSPAYIESYMSLYKDLLQAINTSHSLPEALEKNTQLVNSWAGKTSPNIVAATTGIINEETKNRFIQTITRQLNSTWFKYFLSYDPDPYLKKINCKILALNGSKDIQVIAAGNLSAMQRSLLPKVVQQSEFIEMPGLNHLFQHCHMCTVAEYAQLTETIAPEVLEKIVSWLNAQIGK